MSGETPDLHHLPGLPDSCQLDRLARDWCDAVEAFRRADSAAVATALSPPDLGEVETYTRLVGLIVIAAQMCGVEHRKVQSPNPFGFYAFQALNVETGRGIDPADGMDEANVMAAGRLLTAAANQDHEQVLALVEAHMPFTGDVERSGVLLDLLGIYCAMSSGDGR